MAVPTVETPDVVRNEILRALRPRDLGLVLPSLETVELPLKLVLHHAGRIIDYVYFVETGTVSMVATLIDGTQAEVGLVGREGLVGLPVLLGSPIANLEAVVQVGGTARRMAAAPFRERLRSVPDLRDILLRYVNLFYLQVATTAICNAQHPIEKRLARWILMTADRVESDQFPMTQDFMSRMLGVQRTGVNLASRRLQRAGAIRHVRGWLTLVDRPGLEALSCECYGLVQSNFTGAPRLDTTET